MNPGAPLQVKLCFIGERYVGKTALILRLSESDDLEPMRGISFNEEEVKNAQQMPRKSLKSPDLVSRYYKLPISNNPIKAQFWDQANDSNMFPKSITQAALGIVLVVDVTNRDSFAKVAEWNKRIQTDFKPNVCKVLVGNKMDLNNQRVVEPVEGYKLASSLGFNAYYEVSAIENINVSKPIEDLIQSIYFVNNMSVDSGMEFKQTQQQKMTMQTKGQPSSAMTGGTDLGTNQNMTQFAYS